MSAGIVSLISLAVLSYERYCTMMCPAKPDVTNYTKTAVGVVLSWVYSLVWTLPPFFGWSRYGPEGPGTTCSVDWVTKTANNISYIICLFVFCLILPFLVIVYSYGKLLHAIKQVRRLGLFRKLERYRISLHFVLTNGLRSGFNNFGWKHADLGLRLVFIPDQNQHLTCNTLFIFLIIPSPCANTTPAGFPPSFLQSLIETVWSLHLRLLIAPRCARDVSFPPSWTLESVLTTWANKADSNFPRLIKHRSDCTTRWEPYHLISFTPWQPW